MRTLYYFWFIAMLIASPWFGSLAAAISKRRGGNPHRAFFIGTLLYAVCGFLLPFGGYRLGILPETFATGCIFTATVSAITFPIFQLFIHLLIKPQDT